jgi:hypothetical protein
LEKKTEIREVIADINWKKLGWVLKKQKKTGKGSANDRNSATIGHVSAYFLTTNDTVFSFVALILFFS